MRRRLLFILTVLLWCTVAVWIAGCPAVTAIGYAPITGVNIPIAALLDEANLGCGTGAEDVYKYAVVVAYAPSTEGFPSLDNCPVVNTLGGGLFDCFSEATFANLPLPDADLELLDSGGALPDGASVTIWAWVTFYNEQTYNRLGQDTLEKAVSVQPAVSDGSVESICSLGATWTWTCAATEQGNISASCHNTAVIELGTFPPSADAATEGAAPMDGSKDAPLEATPIDARSEGAVDAGADAPADARGDAPPG